MPKNPFGVRHCRHYRMLPEITVFAIHLSFVSTLTVLHIGIQYVRGKMLNVNQLYSL